MRGKILKMLLALLYTLVMTPCIYADNEGDLLKNKMDEVSSKIAQQDYDNAVRLLDEAVTLSQNRGQDTILKYEQFKLESLQEELKYGRKRDYAREALYVREINIDSQIHDIYRAMACIHYNEIASGYMSGNQVDKSKTILRHIIINYQKFTSCAKKAEFALEDLKILEAKLEKERLEQERVEKDRLEKEKAEQERLVIEKAEEERIAKEKIDQENLRKKQSTKKKSKSNY